VLGIKCERRILPWSVPSMEQLPAAMQPTG
jgi:hypothetical protein